MSAERKYDIVFTNNGIALLLVEGAVKTGIGGFGAADVFINKALSDKKIQDKLAAYGGLTLPEMLSKNDKNAYYLYSDVKSVNVKKSMMGCTMTLEAGEEKYKCTFSGNQMDTANQAISKHLAAKVQWHILFDAALAGKGRPGIEIRISRRCLLPLSSNEIFEPKYLR